MFWAISCAKAMGYCSQRDSIPEANFIHLLTILHLLIIMPFCLSSQRQGHLSGFEAQLIYPLPSFVTWIKSSNLSGLQFPHQ